MEPIGCLETSITSNKHGVISPKSKDLILNECRSQNLQACDISYGFRYSGIWRCVTGWWVAAEVSAECQQPFTLWYSITFDTFWILVNTDARTSNFLPRVVWVGLFFRFGLPAKVDWARCDIVLSGGYVPTLGRNLQYHILSVIFVSHNREDRKCGMDLVLETLKWTVWISNFFSVPYSSVTHELGDSVRILV